MAETANITVLYDAGPSTRAVVYINGELHEAANHTNEDGFVWSLLDQLQGKIVGEIDTTEYLKADYYDVNDRNDSFPPLLHDIPKDEYEDPDNL
jgi:hypothetical protein